MPKPASDPPEEIAVDDEESRLLKNIAESPWTHPPRRDYAAWIEQHGGTSRAEQAEFLRLDVEHEQIIEEIGAPDQYHPVHSKRLDVIRSRLRDLSHSLDPRWLVQVDRKLAIPPDLSPPGKAAAHVIVEFLLREGLTNTGGCQAFYSPLQWKERGGEIGHNSLLILVYDGGDINDCMSTERPWGGSRDLVDRFEQNLRRNGFAIERCTSWYSAIYEVLEFKSFLQYISEPFLKLGHDLTTTRSRFRSPTRA